MWKTLFGRKKSDEEMERIVAQKESGSYKIYPVLKPGTWPGLQAGVLRQVLVGKEDNPQVVIGYGYDTPENIIFLTHQDLEKMDAQQIIKEAYENLENFQTIFEYSTAFHNKLLISSGLDFSSERILCKSHMLKAHQMLNAEEIIVTIPRRRCMMVMDRYAETDFLNAFIAMHNDAWQDDSYGNPPIGNLLFVLKEGEIIGTIGQNQ